MVAAAAVALPSQTGLYACVKDKFIGQHRSPFLPTTPGGAGSSLRRITPSTCSFDVTPHLLPIGNYNSDELLMTFDQSQSKCSGLEIPMRNLDET